MMDYFVIMDVPDLKTYRAFERKLQSLEGKVLTSDMALALPAGSYEYQDRLLLRVRTEATAMQVREIAGPNSYVSPLLTFLRPDKNKN